EAAVVVRFEDLHRAVQNIADEDGAVLTGLEANDRRTGCVAGRRLQAEVAVDAVAVLPQHGTPEYRRDAVGVHEVAAFPPQLRHGTTMRIARVEVHLVGARGQVRGVRERRDPLAVAGPGGPADVVGVGVGVYDAVHALRSGACRRERVRAVRVQVS